METSKEKSLKAKLELAKLLLELSVLDQRVYVDVRIQMANEARSMIHKAWAEYKK